MKEEEIMNKNVKLSDCKLNGLLVKGTSLTGAAHQCVCVCGTTRTLYIRDLPRPPTASHHGDDGTQKKETKEKKEREKKLRHLRSLSVSYRRVAERPLPPPCLLHHHATINLALRWPVSSSLSQLCLTLFICSSEAHHF